MKLLAFDTSTNKGGVAVLNDSQVLSQKIWNREGSHGELLTPALEECLRLAGLKARDLDAVVLGHGPGSFTGVRVSVNAARSLAYALSKPVYAFDTNEILAAGVLASAPMQKLPILTVVNAHKNMLFTSTFDSHGRRTSELAALTIEEIETLIKTSHLCVGDGFEEYSDLMSPDFRVLLVRQSEIADEPEPSVLGRMAWQQRASRPALGWKDVQALYIRSSGAEEKLREDLGKKQ